MSTDPFQPAGPDPAGSPVAPAPARSTPELRPVEPTAVQPRRGGGGMLVNVLLGVALVVAVGGVAFALGRATAPVAAATGRTGFGGQGGFGPDASGAPGRGQGFGGAGGFGGGLSIQGTVEAIDGSSITVKTANGTSVTFGLNGNTSFHRRAAATAADVTTGSTVIVQIQGGRGGFNAGGPGGPAGSGAPTASGAPAAGFGTAGSVTVVPAGG